MITQMPRWSDGGCVDGHQDLALAQDREAVTYSYDLP
jgi:hypothetical protein